MSSDDEPKTLSMISPQSSQVVNNVVPEVEAPAPFEVKFDSVTVQPSALDESMPYRMLEVTTERRKYTIDSTFTCIEVIDRKSRQLDPTHVCVGARLLGGQRRYGKTVHHTKPFPIIGTAAVFEVAAKNGQPKGVQVTSKAIRVVLHVRVSSVVLDPNEPFDGVTNALLLPK